MPKLRDVLSRSSKSINLIALIFFLSFEIKQFLPLALHYLIIKGTGKSQELGYHLADDYLRPFTLHASVFFSVKRES